MNQKGNGEKNGLLGTMLGNVLAVVGSVFAFAQTESIAVKNVIGVQKRVDIEHHLEGRVWR